MSENDNVEFFIGQKFETFKEFCKLLKKYEKQHKQLFATGHDTVRLPKTNYNKELVETLEYKRKSYCCVFGTNYVPKGKGLRKTKTADLGCMAKIRLTITKDSKYLQITELNLTHTNHAFSQKCYHLLPRVRLNYSPKVKEKLIEQLKVKGNRECIQNELLQENVYLKAKDIKNLRATLKEIDGNDLKKSVEYLLEQNAYVSIDQEEGEFKGLFFCTKEMIEISRSHPDIFFIDGTYKLLNTNLIVMLVAVVDSNSLTEIIGVGLLTSEDNDRMKWFLQTVKCYHEDACKHLRCIMADKDLQARYLFKEIFNVKVYICRFHVSKIFKRTIPGIEARENRQQVLQILQDLMYSESAEIYYALYAKLCEVASAASIEYYNLNWHNITNEWVTYQMHSGNIGNMTNNRLESINAGIKRVCDRMSSLLQFLKQFFIFLKSLHIENDFKIVDSIGKRKLQSASDEYELEQYRSTLVSHAAEKIEKSFAGYKFIDIKEFDNAQKICKIKYKSMTLEVTPNSCTCHDWKSTELPCRHILAVRTRYNMCLFDLGLCKPSYTKKFVLNNHRLFESGIAESDILKSSEQPVQPTSVKVHKAKATPIVSVPQKIKKIKPLLNNIQFVVSSSSGENFRQKYDLLQYILEMWNNNIELDLNGIQKLHPIKDINNIGKSFQEFNLEGDGSDESMMSTNELNSIKMPQLKTPNGRPRGFLATTVKCNKKKSRRVLK